MWDLIVSVPDHCLSFYFDKFETSVFFVLESSAKDFCFILCGYETKHSTSRCPGKCMNVNKINYFRIDINFEYVFFFFFLCIPYASQNAFFIIIFIFK